MAVIIGSARHDEFGGIGYGNVKPGDQTGHECETQDWYLHDLGWVVIRAKNAAVREKIAQDMEYICANNHIGYSQPHDQTLYKAAKPFGFNASMVTTDCETDCAKAVRVCVLYAGIDCPDFYTGTEINVLGSTGEFDILRSEKYCKGSEYLLRGDILCTQKQGHTVVVLTDGAASGESVVYKATGNLYLRQGPGTEYKYIAVIKKGGLFYSKTVTENGWAQGEYEGQMGYASLKYLVPTEVSKPQFMITAGNVWMRASAGITGKKIEAIPSNTTVLLTGDTKNVLLTKWYEVKVDGQTGWCSGKLLRA